MGGWVSATGYIYTNYVENINVPLIICNTCVDVRIIIRLLHIVKVFMSKLHRMHGLFDWILQYIKFIKPYRSFMLFVSWGILQCNPSYSMSTYSLSKTDSDYPFGIFKPFLCYQRIHKPFL